MPASLQDVAQKAGVSTSTVSRILNNLALNFAPETRLRVMAAAAEIGYRPNWAAKALSTGRTCTIALLTANVRSSYSLQVIDMARKVSFETRYDVIISAVRFQSNGVLDTSRLISWPIDGILAVDIPPFAIRGLSAGMLDGKPFVSMGRYSQDDADCVHIDFRGYAMVGVRHLRDSGCGRIAFLVPHFDEGDRFLSDSHICTFEAIAQELRLPVEIVLTRDDTASEVMEALGGYIDRRGVPDGLFCFNDNMANGAFRLLRKRGLRIPGDVALAGCSVMDYGAYLDPPLTTVSVPAYDMCRVAWQLLRARMENASIPIRQVTLPPQLDVRTSSLRQSCQKYARASGLHSDIVLV